MGRMSAIKKALGKTASAGKRMGDKDDFQKGSKSTSTSARNMDNRTNRNDYAGNVFDKQAMEDVGKMKKIVSQTSKTGEPLRGAAAAAARDAGVRAASRTATRAAKVAAPIAGVAAAAKMKKEEKKSPAAKTNTSTPKAAADGRTNKEDYPTYKKGTESSAAFRTAFKKAKDAGNKTFTFEGRKYNTKDK